MRQARASWIDVCVTSLDGQHERSRSPNRGPKKPSVYPLDRAHRLRESGPTLIPLRGMMMLCQMKPKRCSSYAVALRH